MISWAIKYRIADRIIKTKPKIIDDDIRKQLEANFIWLASSSSSSSSSSSFDDDEKYNIHLTFDQFNCNNNNFIDHDLLLILFNKFSVNGEISLNSFLEMMLPNGYRINENKGLSDDGDELLFIPELGFWINANDENDFKKFIEIKSIMKLNDDDDELNFSKK
jgi:hypothetical protein